MLRKKCKMAKDKLRCQDDRETGRGRRRSSSSFRQSRMVSADEKGRASLMSGGSREVFLNGGFGSREKKRTQQWTGLLGINQWTTTQNSHHKLPHFLVEVLGWSATRFLHHETLVNTRLCDHSLKRSYSTKRTRHLPSLRGLHAFVVISNRSCG